MENNHGLVFPIKVEDGKLVKVTLSDSIESNIKIMLNWPENSRPFNLNFGSDLERFIGEQNDPSFHMLIRKKINEVVSRYETRATIKDIQFETFNERLQIILEMAVKDSQEIILMNI